MKNILYLILSFVATTATACEKENPNEGKQENQPDFRTLKIGDKLDYNSLKLVWADEFNTDGMVNTADWTYEKGFVRNQEIQYYTEMRPENCKIEDGYLVITGRKETTSSGTPANGSYSDGTITSASITTNKKHSWRYGRLEVRAKVPEGKGPWPAFWAKGVNQNDGVAWPKCGEIDIMEYAGKEPDIMVQNVIYGSETGSSSVSKTKRVNAATPYSDDFHVYSLDWNSRQIAFAIDNVVTHVVEMNTISPNPFNQPIFILLNLALGASEERTMGGKLDENCLPVEFKVDYVRVYQTK